MATVKPVSVSVNIDMAEARKIVSVLYYIILNRKPDASGLETHAKLMVYNGYTEMDIAYALFNSKEYQDRFINKK